MKNYQNTAMKRLFALILALIVGTVQAATIIQPLPNNIQNGQPADATRLMANFNQIVTNVNSNAAAINAAKVFTSPQQFSAGTTPNQGAIVSQVQNDTTVWLGTFAGTANALTATAYPAPSAYASGQRWKGLAAFANTGATTLNLNSLGLRAITKFGGNALVAGDIVAGQMLDLQDDGVHLQLMNPAVPSGLPYADAGGAANAITAAYTIPSTNMTIIDGFDLTVGIATPNTSTAVTFTPTLNATLGATWSVVKFVSGVEVPVAMGDLQGVAWLKADTVNSVWVLMNPNSASNILNTPLTPNSGTVTISIGSPAVISWTSHGRVANDIVVFSTTGALPTGITAGTNYYVISAGLAANTFEISATVGGAPVTTSGSQSGTQSASATGYQMLSTNAQQRIAVNGTMTLFGTASTLGAGFFTYIENNGTGSVTFTSPTSNIYELGGAAAGASSITIPDTGTGANPYNNSQVLVFGDGSNFYVSPIATPHGAQTFLSNGSWTAPKGVFTVWLTGSGPGGNGGAGSGTGTSGVGGAQGQKIFKQRYSVVPGTAYSIIIGPVGGNTSFGALLTLSPGANGASSVLLDNTGTNGQGDGGGLPGYGAVSGGNAIANSGAGGGGAGGGTATAGGAGASGWLTVEW